MTPIAIGIIGLVVLFTLLAIGIPIGAGMALIGFLGIMWLVSPSAAFAKLEIVPFATVANYDLAVLPLFVFMAQLLFNTGLGSAMYNLAAKWLGRLPGGLAMATIAGSAGFATVSATAIGTAATVGLVALPEMKKYKYDPGLATGSIMAGAPIGILIPPSNLFILYGILTETSIGKLFIGGILPGIILALFYMVTIYTRCRLKPELGPKTAVSSFREKMGSLVKCIDVIILVIIILGGMMMGWFTPTEAGAVGAFCAIIITLGRKQLTWEKFKQAVLETAKTVGMVYGILIGAFIFNYFIANSTIPMYLATIVSELAIPSMFIMIIIIAMYIVLGIIMDEAAMFLLTIPIFFPLVMSMGFDAIWFGIIATRMVMIGMNTPPLGVSLYVISGIAPEIPISTIYKGVIPFLIADIFHVALLMAVPALVLILPGLMS
jgi:C4-dicarboxylate transporter DctM subunit